MKLSLIFSALGAFLTLTLAEEVVTLTESNFDEAIENNPFILVEFYAPWCGHCKKLAPEYENAAIASKDLDPKVVLAKVDATAEANLASKFGVKGFPTLKWFVNGKVSDYNGGRTEDTIVSWLVKKTGPAAKILKTVDELKEFQETADAVVVGFFDGEDDAKAFLSHALADDETPYAICYENCAPLKEHAGVDAAGKLIVLQSFDEGKAEFEGDHTQKEEIATFVGGNLLPLIIPFSQASAPKIFNGPIKDQLIVFVKDTDSDDAKTLADSLKPVAKQNQGKMNFVILGEKDKRVVDFFGVKAEDTPTIRIVNMGAGGAKKYKFTEAALTANSVAKFAEDYFAGNVAIDLKSAEPVPESEQGNVRVIVGKDFDKTVDEPGKDVLVEFYAPWCGHCKKLEPEYNALGEHFKDNDSIVIAKVDATANEVERVQISGFPTLKFFPADSEDIVDYDGERTKDGLLKFLKKKAKTLKGK